MGRGTPQPRKKLYSLQDSDLSKAASTLAKAFNAYPVFEYIIPDASRRNRNLKYIFRFLLGLGRLHGEVIAPSSKLEGISIWVPSFSPHSSRLDALRAGLLNLFLHIDTKTIGRLMEIGTIKRKRRDELLGEPYYLCDLIGVDPLQQRQGIGRIMVETKLIEFDKEKIPCYLETSNLENVFYYRRFGFSPLHQYKIAEVDVFCLWRKVNAAKAA